MNEINPFAITTKPERNIVSHGLSYTNQDYSTLKARMMEIIQQKFSKDFNDFAESSLAAMLIELWAFIADQLSFKIDQIANELFIDTVTEAANILRLASLVGFKPSPPTPAKAMFSLSVNHQLTSDLFINTPLPVSFPTVNGLGEKYMELFAADEHNNPTNNPIVVTAGNTFVNNIVGVEGKSTSKTAISTGNPWQQFTLVPNVLQGSIHVAVDDEQWREVDFFSSSMPTTEFRVEYLDKYIAVVIFGDNTTGLIPQKNSRIDIRYRTGGGAGGNISTGSINQVVSIYVSGFSHMVTCTVNNYTKGEGGYDGDSIEDIRRKLPLHMKSQNRAVTGEDYKSICEGFKGTTNGVVGKATVALRNQGCAGNIVDIYILATDGPIGLSKANDNLKKELSAELLSKKMFSDYVCLRDGEIILADIQINVLTDIINKQQEGIIKEKIYRRLANLLSLTNFEFGQTLKEIDIVKVLADIRELEHVTASFMTIKSLEEGHGNISVVSANYYEIIRPDNITVNFQYKQGNK